MKKLSKIKASPVLILAGFAAFIVAGFIFSLIIGFVVLGVSCLALSYLAEDE